MLLILLLFVLVGIRNGKFELLAPKFQATTDFYDDFLKLKSLEDDIKTSLQQDTSDKGLLVSWNEKFQLKQINLTVEYRMQMIKHRDHAFRTNVNLKWGHCVRTYRRSINRMERDYNIRERDCLKSALAAGDQKRKSVVQIGKEIKKWRKSYRYLVDLCKSNYFSEEELASCIVQYVERDNYTKTLQRLIFLKIKAMSELLINLNETLTDLQECLRTSLSAYITDIRYIMKVLDRCYSAKKEKLETT